MLYSPWNPVPWLLFLLGVAICVLSVKAFHRKYPDYPFGSKQLEVADDNLASQIHESYKTILTESKALEAVEADISHHSSVLSGR